MCIRDRLGAALLALGAGLIVWLVHKRRERPVSYTHLDVYKRQGWHILWNITIPTVMPSITICTFLTLTNGFKLFDQNLVLTGGQPFTFQPDGTIIRSTEMLALNIYNTFYLNSNSRGMGQAKACLLYTSRCV